MPKLTSAHKLLDPEIRAKNLQALKWALRGRWHDLARPAMPDPVFLVGCSRSGTTLSYETLGAAPSTRGPRTGRPRCATSTNAWARAGCWTRPAST